LLLQQGLEKRHRLVQSVLDRRIAQLRQTLHRRPGRRLVQRQPARPTRHGQAQQRRAITHFAPTLQRTAGERQRIQIKIRRQAVQHLLPWLRRCRESLHLCVNQNRSPQTQGLF
jgi:type II secretory pathway component PulM